MEHLAVLDGLKDINTTRMPEVKNAIETGHLEGLDGKQVAKQANQCFVELNFASAASIFRHCF